MGESASQASLVCWSEVSLSFEADIFHRTLRVLGDPDQVAEAKELAIKANHKSVSLPEAGRASLDLLDQYITGVLAFSKSGYGWPFAWGASCFMIVLLWALHLRSRGLVSQASGAFDYVDGRRGVQERDDGDSHRFDSVGR